MARILIAALLGVWLLTGLAGAEAPDYFLKSWQQARQQAVEQNKPIYLHFTTTWCGWCRRIEGEVYTTEQGRRALSAYVPASLDCTEPEDGSAPSESVRENLRLFRRFGGEGFPYLVMVTPELAVLHTVNGYVPADQFVAELQKGQEALHDWDAFKLRAATQPAEDYDFAVQAMTSYQRFRVWDKAMESARTVRRLDPSDANGNNALAALIDLMGLDSPSPSQMPRTAPATQPARDEQIASLLAEIRKLDSDNAKNVLEQAFGWRVYDLLKQASGASEPASESALLSQAAELLEELTADPARKLQARQLHLARLGMIYAASEQPDKARATWEKAIAVDPASRIAEQIRSQMQRLPAPK